MHYYAHRPGSGFYEYNKEALHLSAITALTVARSAAFAYAWAKSITAAHSTYLFTRTLSSGTARCGTYLGSDVTKNAGPAVVTFATTTVAGAMNRAVDCDALVERVARHVVRRT